LNVLFVCCRILIESVLYALPDSFHLGSSWCCVQLGFNSPFDALTQPNVFLLTHWPPTFKAFFRPMIFIAAVLLVNRWRFCSPSPTYTDIRQCMALLTRTLFSLLDRSVHRSSISPPREQKNIDETENSGQYTIDRVIFRFGRRRGHGMVPL
jgi:hypothetical protein